MLKKSYKKTLSFVHDPGAIFMFPRYTKTIDAEALRETVDRAIDSGADRFITEIYGKVTWYPSKVYSPEEHSKWFTETFGKDAYCPHVQFALDGNDFIQILCDKTHEKGAEYWLTYRLNDHHLNTYQITAENADPRHVCKFYMDHLDCRIGEEQGKFVWTKYLLDMQYREVREHKLAMIEELIENYDIEGFIIDFLRTPALFNQSTTTVGQRNEIMTEFLGQVRAMLDRKSERTGKTYRFGVKIPQTLEYYSNLGIDVKAYAALGVDTFYVFDYFNVVQDYRAIDLIKSQCPGCEVIQEMGHVTRWMRNYSPEKPRYMRLATKEQFCTTSYVAYRHGADGVSLFNFPWYRSSSENDKAYEPPFEIFPLLKDATALSMQPQHYFEAETENKMPRPFDLEEVLWQPGECHSFPMEMCRPTGGWKGDGVLRLQNCKVNLQALELQVQINGTELFGTLVTDEPYESPYRSMLGTPENWLSFRVPKEVLKEGSNRITVCNHSKQTVKLDIIDLAIS